MQGALLDLADKLDSVEVEIILCIDFQDLIVGDAARLDEVVASKLCCSPDKGEKVVLIQAPDTVRPCWLQPACVDRRCEVILGVVDQGDCSSHSTNHHERFELVVQCKEMVE